MLSRYLTFSIIFTSIVMQEVFGYQNLIPLEDKRTKNTFDRLLNNLARVNKERLKSMKRETYLQEMKFTNGNFETEERNDQNSLPDEDASSALPFLTQLQNSQRAAEGHTSSLQWSLESLNPPRAFGENDTVLRRELPTEAVMRSDWRRPCDKSASKQCINACRTAMKNVCNVFKCSRRAKSRFKSECKRCCRSRFMSSGRYSDNSDYTDY